MAAAAGLGADGRRSRRVPRRPAPGGARSSCGSAGSTSRATRRRPTCWTTSSPGPQQALDEQGGYGAPADHRRQGRLPVRRLRVARSPTRTTPPGPARPPCGCSRSPRRCPSPTSRWAWRPGACAAGPTATPSGGPSAASGDAVNLAARLMTRAPAGGIWVHGDVADAADDRFVWDELPAITVKGRQQEVPRTRLLAPRGPASGRRHGRGSQRDGRSRGRAGAAARTSGRRPRAARARWSSSRPRPAPASPGSSASWSPSSSPTACRSPRGEATPLATQASYAGWRDVWSDLLGLDERLLADRRDATRSSGSTRGWSARAPLLGPVLGLSLPDSDLTASFDGELRKTSLEDLLGRLLGALAAAGRWRRRGRRGRALAGPALPRPAGVARAHDRPAHPVLLVVTSRPDGTALAGLPARPRRATSPTWSWSRSEPEASAVLVASGTGPWSAASRTPSVLATIVGRAEGNAFYLEQLVDYVLAHAAREDGSIDPDALELPPSLHSLVLSRIDAQPEGPRRAVKVASVIGRAFRSPLVAAAYPDLGPEPVVHDDLVTAGRHPPDRPRGPRGQGLRVRPRGDPRRRLRLPALQRALAAARPGRRRARGRARRSAPAPRPAGLPLLPQRRRGQEAALPRLAAAAARAAYANEAAISYLEQLLPLVGDDERNGVLLQLAESLEVRGDWAAAEDAVSRAREAAEAVADAAGVARARTATAELARKQGRFVEAESELAAAEAAFVEIGDEAGQARVLHLRGTLASQQGHPDQARAAYEASLALREASRRRGRRRRAAHQPRAGRRGRGRPRRGRAARSGGPGASPRASATCAR